MEANRDINQPQPSGSAGPSGTAGPGVTGGCGSSGNPLGLSDLPRKPTYLCSDCDKVFTQESFLRKHEARHVYMKPYECSRCGGRFSYRNDLYRHKNSAHNEHRWNCHVYGTVYVENGDLKINLRIDQVENQDFIVP